ncbi:MAG: transporter substrate-binding domain-containing protein [Desulfobacter sp.]|nr:transporter substrate-binding domain-containing protein [Desulfobacter sp.]
MLTDGKIQGIAIDYLTQIFGVHGIKIKYVHSSEVTWPQALEYIKQHEVVDLVPTVKITEKRQKDMIFTDEYIFAPWVIFTRSDADFVSSMKDLKGKTIAVEEGYAMHLILKQNYPDIKLKVVSARRENFAQIPIRDLSTGLADAYIGNLLSTTYTIQTKGYTNIKVAAPTPFGNHNQAMGIRSDWPELASIINKTLASMRSEEHAAILNKWLSVRYEYGIDKNYVLKWVLTVTGIALVLIGFVLVWNKQLRNEAISRKKMETALKDSESKFKALFNNAQVALFRTRISDGKLLEINQRYANMAGYQTVEDCMAEFNAADAWADAGQRTKLVETLKKDGFVLDHETKIIRRDKVAFWIAFSATIYPEKGYIEGSIVDITQRKHAEERFFNSRQLLNEVGSIAKIGGWEHDLITREVTWTRETYKIVEIESGGSLMTLCPVFRQRSEKFLITPMVQPLPTASNLILNSGRLRQRDGTYGSVLSAARSIKTGSA